MAMVTTVQLQKTTKQLLERFKERENLASFDQTIMRLLKEREQIPEDMFGFAKKHPFKFSKKDRIRFHEL